MSVYEPNRTVPLGAITTYRLVSLFERAIESFRAWQIARATETALGDLSDAQLADIGLHRSEIGIVASRIARL